MSISALAECVATIRAESEHHRTAIGLHTADTLAVLGAGLKAREGERIARFFSGGDEAMRAAGMAAVIRFTECDDIHVPSCMTAGAIVIPVALTFAVDSQSYARAVEAGYAVGLAFAQGVGGVRALAQGVWPALFAAPAVAAVTASVAMKCDRAVTASALGLAMAGASGRAGRPGGWPSGRWLLFGEAALKGVRAALAALQGFRGDIDLISETWLRQQTTPELADIEHLSGLVEGAVAQVGFKPYVAARQGANAIQAFVTLLDQGLAPDTIGRVEVFLPKVATGIVTRPARSRQPAFDHRPSRPAARHRRVRARPPARHRTRASVQAGKSRLCRQGDGGRRRRAAQPRRSVLARAGARAHPQRRGRSLLRRSFRGPARQASGPARKTQARASWHCRCAA